jgi:glutaredoxin
MNFTVYSKQGCPYCDKVVSILNHISGIKGCPIKVYSLGSDFTREQFYSEFGEGSTFPQVIMNEIKLGGCSDTVKYLTENKII